jgi:hypothetical protein
MVSGCKPNKRDRRSVKRIVPSEAHWNTIEANFWHYSPEGEKSLSERKALCVNLLQVCKQIFNEAAPMPYSQRVVFVDSSTMVCFLEQLSPRSAKLLRHLEIRRWNSTRSRKSHGYVGMTLLSAKGAVNVEKIVLNCPIEYFSWR